MEWNLLSVLNAVAYVLNVVLVYLSNTGAYGKTNSEQSAKYQALVTPKGYAFAIWGAIYFLEGAFALYQLFPTVWRTKLIQEGVWYWWIVSTLIQIAWSVAFAQDAIILSEILMLLLWASLAAICISLLRLRNKPHTEANTQSYVTYSYPKWSQYICIYVPFSLHFGWVTAASVANTNILVVWSHYTENGIPTPDQLSLQLTVAVLSLALLVLCALISTVCISTHSDAVYAGAIGWAILAIAQQLDAPRENIVDRFPSLVTDGLGDCAYVLGVVVILHGVYGVLRNIYGMYKKTDTNQNMSSAQSVADTTVGANLVNTPGVVKAVPV